MKPTLSIFVTTVALGVLLQLAVCSYLDWSLSLGWLLVTFAAATVAAAAQAFQVWWEE